MAKAGIVTQFDTSGPAVGRGAPSGSGMGFDDSVFNRLLKERIIFLGQQFDDEMANRICAQLLLLSAEDPTRDIALYVNSPGGSVSSGMAIYDTMQFIPNDVATYGLGLAASMGQFILCAGARGKRFALPHTRVMMHQPSGGIGGSASDIAIQAEQMLYTKKLMQERIAFHTGQSVDEAKEYGLIDAVLPTTADVASASSAR
jgi:ATP-dependent Clp protease protease subunit